VGWLAAAAAVAALLWANVPTQQGWVYLTLGLAVAVLIVHLAHGSSLITRALATRPMRWLGRRSYGIYLIHTLALTVAEKVVPGGAPVRTLWLGVGCLALTLVAGDVAHRLVEVPFIQLGRRWAGRRGRVPAPVPAVTAS
jgi:peptidoglycan/LPS O-acetylase OafA/YrhL